MMSGVAPNDRAGRAPTKSGGRSIPDQVLMAVDVALRPTASTRPAHHGQEKVQVKLQVYNEPPPFPLLVWRACGSKPGFECAGVS